MKAPVVDAARRGAADLDVVRSHPARQHHGALEQHVEAGRGGALGVDGARLVQLHVPALAQPLQLVLAQLLEQEQ